MRVPVNWLRDYVTLDLPVRELCDRLTMTGLTVEEIEEFGDDTVLTLEVTSNRGDWLSLIGVAREVAALTGKELRLPESEVAESGAPTADSLSVDLLDPDLGPRYSARVIRGVKVGPSPAWLRQRLEAVGVRPINNVVDATNYVCFEYGQPLHAFDLAKIPSQQILVRRARNGERIVTIDEEDRQLTGDMLVIADAEKPVAVAGIMGGLDTEVSDSTVDVLLESAHFAPESVRQTAKKLALRSEASYRFERWVDPNGAVEASNRACRLILETAGGAAGEGVVDVYPSPLTAPTVEMSVSRCRQVLGVELSATEIEQTLTSLQLDCEVKGDVLRCTVPTFRNDIHMEADLVEEVARLYGYDKIPTTVPPNLSPQAGLSDSRRLERAVGELLRSCGLNEMVSYSLTTPEQAQQSRLPLAAEAIALRNPLTRDATHLRNSLLPNLLQVLAHNVRQRVDSVWGYELGKVYLPGGTESPARELRRLALCAMGSRVTSSWNLPADQTAADFYTLKGIAEELLRLLGIVETQWAPTQHAALHPHRAAEVLVNGDPVGVLGEVRPDLAEELGLTTRAYVAEFDYDALAATAVPSRDYVALSTQPAADRDVAFVLNRQHTWAEAEAVIRRAAGPLLESLSLFDEYRGKQIGEENRSLACTLRFRDPDRTLNEGEADEQMAAVHEALTKELSATVRR